MKTIRPESEGYVKNVTRRVTMVTEKALALFGNEAGWKGRQGGYFCLADGETGIPLLITPIGQVPTEKAQKYLALCQEKAARLALHPNHLSSWQSRDENAQQWGGAIRSGEAGVILSISGFPELGDEAIMAAVATVLFPRNNDSTFKIPTISNNPYWERLWKEVHTTVYVQEHIGG